MGLNDTIGDLATGAYTITRRAGGTYSTGHYSGPGAVTTIAGVVAVVTPYATGRGVRPLPEGVRAEDVRIVMTATLIRTRDAGGEADSVAIGGEDFYCYAVEGPWTLDGDTHYEAYVARRAKP